ncbi:MAG TPA: transcriptional repressor [Burkholderiaceae bacterium]|nr:transcriptional repressor [Burkholderiaceae bacterium]
MNAARTIDDSLLDQARSRVRGSGARVTFARVRVLAELMRAGRALSHLEAQRRVDDDGSGEAVDRVTLYRVLEWLVEAGLAHRVAGPDRVFRFSASAPGLRGQHGHFRCTRCDRMYCLQEANIARLLGASLPAGFSSENVELTVSGCCAQCAA